MTRPTDPQTYTFYSSTYYTFNTDEAQSSSSLDPVSGLSPVVLGDARPF